MEEDLIKFKQIQIDTIAKELRSHFVYNEFFVDPNKNFLKKLETVIKFFEEDDFIIHIKQNEQLYRNFKEKYENAIIKNYEQEREHIISNSNNVLPTESTDRSIKTNSSNVSPKILYDDGVTLPMNNTTINSSEFTINEAKNVAPQIRNVVNFCEFEKLKDDYLNLLEEKKFVDSQLEKYDLITKDNYDLKYQIQVSKEKINEFNERINKLNVEKRSLNERCLKTSKENSEMLEELNKLREILNHHEKEKNNIKAKLNSVNNKLRLQEKEITGLKKKHQNLHFENKNLKEKLEDELFAKNNIEKKYIDKLSYFESYIDELQNSNSKLTKENIIIFLKNINENDEVSRLIDFNYLPNKNMVELFYEGEKVTEIVSKNMNSEFKSQKTPPRSFFLDLSKIKLMNNDTQYFPRKRNSHRDKIISQRNMNPGFKSPFGAPLRDLTNISDVDAHSKSPVKESLSSRIPQKNSMTETKEKYQPIYSKIFSISSKKSSNSNSRRSKLQNENKFCQIVTSKEFVMDTKGSTNREEIDATARLSNLYEKGPSSIENDFFTNRENEHPNPRKKIEFNKFKYVFSSSQQMKNRAICLDELLSNEPSPQVNHNDDIYKKIIEEEATPVNHFDNEDDEDGTERIYENSSFRIQNVAKIELTSASLLNQKFNNLEVSKTTDSFIANDQDTNRQPFKSNAEKNYSINISNNNILDFSFDENNKRREDTKMESTLCDGYIINKEIDLSYLKEIDNSVIRTKKKCKKKNCRKCNFDVYMQRNFNIPFILLNQIKF